jgi:hypothetical protein
MRERVSYRIRPSHDNESQVGESNHVKGFFGIIKPLVLSIHHHLFQWNETSILEDQLISLIDTFDLSVAVYEVFVGEVTRFKECIPNPMSRVCCLTQANSGISCICYRLASGLPTHAVIIAIAVGKVKEHSGSQ